MKTTHAPDLLNAEYHESGGYDCMTGAYVIKTRDQTICRLDLADYGQPNCQSPTANTLARAEADANRLADCWNACATLPDPAVVPELVGFLRATINQETKADGLRDSGMVDFVDVKALRGLARKARELLTRIERKATP